MKTPDVFPRTCLVHSRIERAEVLAVFTELAVCLTALSVIRKGDPLTPPLVQSLKDFDPTIVHQELENIRNIQALYWGNKPDDTQDAPSTSTYYYEGMFPDGWVAEDENGSQWFYTLKPELNEAAGKWELTISGHHYEIPPFLTNRPVFDPALPWNQRIIQVGPSVENQLEVPSSPSEEPTTPSPACSCPKGVFSDGWLAEDEDGEIYYFLNKPKLDKDHGMWKVTEGGYEDVPSWLSNPPVFRSDLPWNKRIQKVGPDGPVMDEAPPSPPENPSLAPVTTEVRKKDVERQICKYLLGENCIAKVVEHLSFENLSGDIHLRITTTIPIEKTVG